MLKKVKNKVKKVKCQIVSLLALIYVMCAGSSTVYATGFKGSIYETGTKKMMADLLAVGQGIVAAVVLVLWIVWELQKRFGEENDESRYSKKQKGAIVGLIIAETIGTLFGIIGGYYGVSIK